MKQCCLHSLDGKHLLLGWRKSADLEWSKILIQCCKIWRVRDVLHSGCVVAHVDASTDLVVGYAGALAFSVSKNLGWYFTCFTRCFWWFVFFHSNLYKHSSSYCITVVLGSNSCICVCVCVTVIPWHLSGERLAQKNYLDLIHGSKTWVTGGLWSQCCQGYVVGIRAVT